jgi:DMSO/TMAO reductase YedYZ molybdopterin-dependent catalytic subunit
LIAAGPRHTGSRLGYFAAASDKEEIVSRSIGDLPPGVTASEQITREELQLATRNHGMPLEALRYPVTPIGLHYLLIHYDIPAVDATGWRLHLEGAVNRPLTLALDDLQSRPAITRPVTLECAGNGRARLTPRAISQPWLLEAVGTAAWTGTPLWPLLGEAGISGEAVEVVFTGLDRGVEGGVEQRYARSLPIDEARREDVLLAWGLNGQPLPPQHGFPLRLLVPGWYGMASVKWLERITVVSEPFDGYQQVQAYRYRQIPEETGEPVTRIEPRSLVIPPGIPDFLSRQRLLAPGPCQVEGRAWSGWGPIVEVQVSVDGGSTWEAAALGDPPAAHAWQAWSYRWHPVEQGTYELCCRATDATGRQQPMQPQWNLGGYADNEIHRVMVTVTSAPTARHGPATPGKR